MGWQLVLKLLKHNRSRAWRRQLTRVCLLKQSSQDTALVKWYRYRYINQLSCPKERLQVQDRLKFDNFDHDFHSIFALILYDLALNALGILNSKSAILRCAWVYHNDCKCHLVFFKKILLFLSLTIRVKPFLEQHIINQVSESLNRDWDVSPKKFPAEVGLSGNQTQVCPLNVHHSLSSVKHCNIVTAKTCFGDIWPLWPVTWPPTCLTARWPNLVTTVFQCGPSGQTNLDSSL